MKEGHTLARWGLPPLVVLLAPPVGAREVAKPQDPRPVERQDPEIAGIGMLLGEAKTQIRAGNLDEARATVREAFQKCVSLVELAERQDAFDLLFEIGLTARDSGDLERAHDAWRRVCDYRQSTLSDDHPDLQAARAKLASARWALGDLPGARALFEKVYEVRCRSLPEDHIDLQRARLDLAITKYASGDLVGAKASCESVYELWSRTLSDDDPDLQRARANLAVVRGALGDLRGALALEQKVYDVERRTLPDDHPNLQKARVNLAATKRALGDLAGARELEEKVYEAWSRTLPDDDPDLQVVRLNLAATKAELGDLVGALELEERVYEVRCRTLPDDHPDLQLTRAELALTKESLGDFAGARVLEEKVYEVRSRTLPDDHPDLQRARVNLANTKHAIGDFRGARVLDEKIYEVWSSRLPDHHPDLQRARANLALTKKALGDFSGARELEEMVYETRSRTLPDDHPDLQAARLNLAATRFDLGDLVGAHTLFEKAYEVRSRTLPDDHPDLQAVRNNLARTEAALGDLGDALRLARQCSDAARRRLSTWALAPRELGAMAAQEKLALDLVLALVEGLGELTPQPQLGGRALLLSQALRGVETRTARLQRRAHANDPNKSAELEHDLRAAVGEVTRIAGEAVPGEGAERAAKLAERSERLAGAVLRKELLQRALVELAARTGGVDAAAVGTSDLAAALPERSAAVAIIGYRHADPDPAHPGRTIHDARLGALVLGRDAGVRWVALGRTADVQPAIDAVRGEANPRAPRGLRPAEAGASSDQGLTSARAHLGEALLAPLVGACGPIDTLFVAVDELLELVPLDALPLDDDELVGHRVTIRTVVSLFDLLEPTAAAIGEEPRLVAVGGLDYGHVAEGPASAIAANAAAPVVERSGDGIWVPLPGTAREADRIAGLFVETFAEGGTERLAEERAGKAQLTAAVTDATFVHLATHGYFAPETVKSTVDVPASRDALGEPAITGLSPLSLCGLALSGANLPPDDLGRHAGILTAEEILSLDLSHCYLVTLSACDTSLGVHRAGQGYASLRAALQGAGARFVLTSLWKVGDEATMELMVDFYRRLWKEKQDPHRALWEAKMAARKKGAAFRDWAGWVLTGR